MLGSSVISTPTDGTNPEPLLTEYMPDSPHPGSVEWLILDLRLEQSGRTWGIGELVDAVGSPILVAEALDALQAARLVERTDVFVRIAQA
jgi:hypothetical protein